MAFGEIGQSPRLSAHWPPPVEASDDIGPFAINQVEVRRSTAQQYNFSDYFQMRVMYANVERIPPPLNQTPQDTADKPARTLIDVGRNRLLLDLIAQRIKEQNYQGSLAEKVGEAVREIIASSGQLSHRIPWWQQFVADAQADLSWLSASTLQQIRTATIAYANAYYEENPIG